MVFSGILRRDHHEGLLQRMRLIVDGNLRLTHRFQQTALGLRGRPIDLVGQYDIREDRAWHEFKGLLLPVKNRDPDNVGGKQVTGKLDALEGAIERPRQAMRERGFPNPWHVFEQEMASRQKGHDTHLDHMRFALNDLGNIVLDRANSLSGIHSRARRLSISLFDAPTQE